MKFLAKTLLLTAAFTASSIYAKNCGGEIKFAKGATETTIKGSVAGNQICEYTFYAKKGQFLRTSMGINDHPYVVLWEPVNEQLIDGEYFLLPKSGKYVLRVLLTRNDARKFKKSQPFTLRFEISAK